MPIAPWSWNPVFILEGKEREGKERKGKERKGKERKERKERKGKERTFPSFPLSWRNAFLRESFPHSTTLHLRRFAPCLVHLPPGAPCLSLFNTFPPTAKVPHRGTLHIGRCLGEVDPGALCLSWRNTFLPCAKVPRPRTMQRLRLRMTFFGAGSLCRILSTVLPTFKFLVWAILV